MDKALSVNDVSENLQSKISVQDYSKKPVIDGVKIVDVKNFVGEDGDFSELFRINENGEVDNFPGFKIAQINRSKLIPGAIKAWHLHFNQDEIWHVVPSNRLVVGLWDVRANSATNNVSMKIVLGGGISKLLYIPRGVAHGCANFTKKDAELFYFVSNQFDINNPDEKRFKWDENGADFWTPTRE